MDTLTSSPASRAGFTLLEAIVALAILGTGVAVVLALVADGASVTRRAEVRVLAVELAESRLEEILLPGVSARSADGERGGFAGAEGFTWAADVSPGPAPGTLLVEVSVMGEGDSVHLATLVRE